MMREVTLYTVQEDKVMAHNTVSFHRMHPFDINATPVNADLTLATVERIDVPVRHYRESMMLPGECKMAHKDSYIAIDPKLEYMIRQPIVEQMEVVEKRANSTMRELMLYQDRISDYNSLPWYKRIFRRV